MHETRWQRKLRRFGAMSRADKWLFLRAVGWLAVARIWLAFVPFRKLAERLRESNLSSDADPAALSRVSFAVSAASANVPWRSDCFPKAIAASKLLQSLGHGSSIHLGVERAGETELLGHAWLTCGSIVVTGGEERHRYVEIHRLGE
jgi:hypothetical protein